MFMCFQEIIIGLIKLKSYKNKSSFKQIIKHATTYQYYSEIYASIKIFHQCTRENLAIKTCIDNSKFLKQRILSAQQLSKWLSCFFLTYVLISPLSHTCSSLLIEKAKARKDVFERNADLKIIRRAQNSIRKIASQAHWQLSSYLS